MKLFSLRAVLLAVFLLAAFIAVAVASNNNSATGFQTPSSKIKDFRETM